MKLYTIQSTRTNNFKDTEMLEKIQHVWQEARTHLQGQSCTVYGIYHDYESDYKGDYSLSTAAADSSGEASFIEIPSNMEYQTFVIDSSDPQAVLQQWKMIWQLEEQGELIRAYTVDYEQYDPDGKVTIHIAVQPNQENVSA